MSELHDEARAWGVAIRESVTADEMTVNGGEPFDSAGSSVELDRSDLDIAHDLLAKLRRTRKPFDLYLTPYIHELEWRWGEDEFGTFIEAVTALARRARLNASTEGG